MNKIFHYVSFFLVIIFFLASCTKDSEGYIVADGSFNANALTASANNIMLSPSTQNDTVVTFSWLAANFGKQPAITYTLQFDIPSDTVKWTKAKTFLIDGNVLQFAFNGLNLNNLLTQFGLPTNVSDIIAIRVRADVNPNDGTAATISPAFSNTILENITPYAENLYITGTFQNPQWIPSAAPPLNPFPGSPGLYEAYINFPVPGTQYFKYVSAQDFNHINYGDGGNGTMTTNGSAGAMYASSAGYYELWANLTKNTWVATKTTWSVIGDAVSPAAPSGGGWTNDNEMTYDATDSVWTVTLPMLATGSFKFRANDQWVIDFGVDANGNLQYADNPVLPYINNGNPTLSADGTYKITLDLHISGKHTYTAVKQ